MEKLVIVLESGRDNLRNVVAATITAKMAAKKGIKTKLIAQNDAVHLFDHTVAENIIVDQFNCDLHHLFLDVQSQDYAEVMVCEQSCEERNVTERDLMFGPTLADKEKITSHISESHGALSF